MTILGVLVLGGLAVAVAARRSWVAPLLGVGAGLPFSSAVVVAGNGVPLFHAAGLVAAVLLFRTTPLRTRHWTANALAAFAVWAVVVTLLAPWAFAGTRVLSARGGVDVQVVDPDRLTYTISTLAQLAYLVIALLVVLYLVRAGGTRIAVEVGLAVGTASSTIRDALVQAGGDDLSWLFDTSPTALYAELAPGLRHRGVFSEPSEAAAFSLPAAVFFALAAVGSRGRARVVRAVLCACACTNLLGASSGTAVVASAVVIGGGLVVLAVRWAVNGGAGTPWAVLGALSVGILVLALDDALWAPVLEIVDEKIGSQSYTARTGADAFSWHVVRDSLGLGVGLGGNRPSSFALSVLSCVGVPGALLWGAVLVGALVAAHRAGRTPIAVTLLALLVAKVVGTPDLSTPMLWVTLAAALAVAWRTEVAEAPVGTRREDRRAEARTA